LAQVVRLTGIEPWKRPGPPPPAVRREWTTHRDYWPGDDLLRVDWPICARLDELLTRRAGRVVEGPLYVFVDCSSSMSLGRPPKIDAARQIAAAVGYVGLDRLDEVSIMGFGEGIAAECGPLCGRSQAMLLLRFLERLSPRPGGTDLARAAAGWTRRRARPGPVVVIGDLYHPENLFRGLGVFCDHGCWPHVVQVIDPAEASPRVRGEVELCDAETGGSWTTTVTARRRARYRHLYAQYCRSICSFCARHRIGYVAIPTNLTREEMFLRVIGIRVLGDQTSEVLETSEVFGRKRRCSRR
jgi:uncharacterized protein (DUF58 family)